MQNKYIYCKLKPVLLLCIGFAFFYSPYRAIAQAFAKPMVLEITGRVGEHLKWEAMLTVIKQNAVSYSLPYKWNNHLILFGELPDTNKLKKELALIYPGSTIKIYNHPFYNFNRKYCSNGEVAKKWDNIILTADLVADPKMQQEYLEHHRTQFQKWPEVSNGFCHANFQQLLVFKNGRQLMLIISIPKGESLDKLNPKTTENNPRMVEWNKMMAKYQEGIPGTKKGEVWVFLSPVSNTVSNVVNPTHNDKLN